MNVILLHNAWRRITWSREELLDVAYSATPRLTASQPYNLQLLVDKAALSCYSRRLPNTEDDDTYWSILLCRND
jgi:hypothetical protein